MNFLEFDPEAKSRETSHLSQQAPAYEEKINTLMQEYPGVAYTEDELYSLATVEVDERVLPRGAHLRYEVPLYSSAELQQMLRNMIREKKLIMIMQGLYMSRQAAFDQLLAITAQKGGVGFSESDLLLAFRRNVQSMREEVIPLILGKYGLWEDNEGLLAPQSFGTADMQSVQFLLFRLLQNSELLHLENGLQVNTPGSVVTYLHEQKKQGVDLESLEMATSTREALKNVDSQSVEDFIAGVSNWFASQMQSAADARSHQQMKEKTTHWEVI